MRVDSAVVTAPVPTRSSLNFSNREDALAVMRTSAAFMGNCMPAERIQYLTSQTSSAYLFIAILKLILSRRGPLFFRDIVQDRRFQRFLVLWGEAPPPHSHSARNTNCRKRKGRGCNRAFEYARSGMQVSSTSLALSISAGAIPNNAWYKLRCIRRHFRKAVI